MAAKLTALFLTLIVNAAIGVVVFFFMLVALNGFSESDGEKGLLAYIVLAVTVSLLMSGAAALAVHYLVSRGLHAVAAIAISVAAFSIVGGLLKVISSFIGIAIADFVRRNY